MKIVMLCSIGDSSAIVYNKLSQHFKIEKVIIEEKTPRKVFLKRRIKRLGFFKTMGQVAFSAVIVPILKKESADRQREILDEYNVKIDYDKLLNENTLHVSSVNSKECIEELQELNPDIIVVNGTRIISKEVLNCVDATFINMHAGITPKYRGSHGAYWALYNNDKQNAGVTVHFVDEGIDTGNILYQSVIPITEKDNFVTYPLLQTCIGVNDEIKAINDIIAGNPKTISNDLPSSLYTHPTFFEYIYHRLKYGVK